ncbi:hypothetical protein BBW68_06765 [Candidatus Erwinia dacicola]|uniref:Uncharacterized protein n=2 Tax=Candidatus Erwinia dacicola TaxID=252393 RepID=A0A1E7Z2Z3_9GAMM|nr:hypothetical protein BBW68_06765 [Candidatus Erwinia dacicola]
MGLLACLNERDLGSITHENLCGPERARIPFMLRQELNRMPLGAQQHAIGADLRRTAIVSNKKLLKGKSVGAKNDLLL